MYDRLYQYSQKLSLLIVEDYKPLRDDLVDTLEDFFNTVTYAIDGRDGLEKYKLHYETYHCGFDIVISDIQMPYIDGIAMSQTIREIDKNQLLIILSAHTDSDYLLSFINLGISQFITKPIDKNILFETLYQTSKQKLMLDNTKSQNIVFISNEYIWNISQRELLKNKQPIILTENERIIFELLIEKREAICSNSDINYIFSLHNININEKNIRNYIFNLRKKISPKLIRSIYGIGYRLSIFNLE